MSVDSNNKYIINDPNVTGITDTHGVVKLTRLDLEKIISFLARNYELYPDKLSSNHPVLRKLNILKTAISYLRGRSDYSVLSEIINQQFRPSQINDGTIGAFLFGCMQQDYGDLERACSIACLKSFNPDNVLLNCSYQLWVQETNHGAQRFKLFHDGTNSDHSESGRNNNQRYVPPERPNRAIIYIHANFNGFSQEEINSFSSNGIVLAELMIKDGSRYRRVQPLSRLDKLPQIQEDGRNVSSLKNTQNNFTRWEDQMDSTEHDFTPTERFGNVTSSILMEDGVYVPFVTVVKGYDDSNQKRDDYQDRPKIDHLDNIEIDPSEHNQDKSGLLNVSIIFIIAVIAIIFIIICIYVYQLR